MDLKKFGNSDLSVSPMCFGGNVLGWTLTEQQSFEILDAWFGAGGNFIDTANSYSRWVSGNLGGESETIIGRWMASRGIRNKVVIATKVGADMGTDGKGLSPKHIQHAVEDSLRRLQTDHIDLYQSHFDDLNTPFTETLATYTSLIEAGKVRFIGASNLSASRLQDALDASARHKLTAYVSLQTHYNLCERDGFEQALASLCRSAGLAVMPYYALASGFLSGKYRTAADLGKSARGSGAVKYLNPHGLGILDVLDAVSRRYTDATPAQIALAWLMAQPAVTTPVVSATNRSQLDELIAATRLRLLPACISQLNQASASASARPNKTKGSS
jgi:aryl-alcohol dehydrogenase-like predicted oxidoreductase